MLAWLSVWGEVQICIWPADTTATHCFLLQETQTGFGFTFLALGHPGSPGQNPESCKMAVVVVVVVVNVAQHDYGTASTQANHCSIDEN